VKDNLIPLNASKLCAKRVSKNHLCSLCVLLILYSYSIRQTCLTARLITTRTTTQTMRTTTATRRTHNQATTLMTMNLDIPRRETTIMQINLMPVTTRWSSLQNNSTCHQRRSVHKEEGKESEERQNLGARRVHPLEALEYCACGERTREASNGQEWVLAYDGKGLAYASGRRLSGFLSHVLLLLQHQSHHCSQRHSSNIARRSCGLVSADGSTCDRLASFSKTLLLAPTLSA
jgi:hypothetical protein